MKLTLTLFLPFIYSIGLCQILDTSKAHRYAPAEIFEINEIGLQNLQLDTIKLDTSLNGFEKYYDIYQNQFPFLDLGLEGSSNLNLSKANNRESKFNLGVHNVDYYFFNDSIKIYQTKKPFTRLNYSQGNKELVYIDIIHAQQISERLSFGINYRRLKNQNFYYSNIANIDRVRMNNLFNTKFYTGYYSKNRKYEMLFSYLWNSSRNVESGGLDSTEYFNSLSGRNKIDNNTAVFTDANSTQAQNQFTLLQYYRPGGNTSDTNLKHSLERFTNQFYLKTKFASRRVEFEDNNADSLNYGYNLENFKDSIYHRTFSNEFGYVLKIKPLFISAGLLHSLDRIYMFGKNTYFNNVYAKSHAGFNYKIFRLFAKADLGLFGYNLGDYILNANAQTELNDLNISVGILSQLTEPQYLEQNLNTATVNWSNQFVKTSINQIKGGLTYSKGKHRLSANLLVETTKNIIYIDSDTVIKQHNDFISLLKLNGVYRFQNKYFGNYTQVMYQNVSNTKVLPRPTLSASTNIYTQFGLFKRKLFIQPGIKAYWFSNFVSPVYNPLIRNWQLGSTDYEMYAPISVYANAKVKSFNFGIELFHAQMQLMGNDYYSSPLYPLMPRTLRVNIRWDLNN